MRKTAIIPLTIFLSLLAGCIGNDFVFDAVDPVLRIMNPVDSLGLNDSYPFDFTYLNNVGQEDPNVSVLWESNQPDVVSIEQSGLATALKAGTATIKVSANIGDSLLVADSLEVFVGDNTVVSNSDRTGQLRTTTFYTLEGDFTLSDEDGELTLSLSDNYKASSGLPGLYVYLTNNPNTTNGAIEIGEVKIFEGAHSFEVPSGVELKEFQYVLYFCKPFNVKVGDGTFDD